MGLWSALLLFALPLFAAASENVYFYVTRNDPACFVDEVMQTATLLVKYKHEDFATKPLRFKLTMDGTPVKTESITAREGRFAHAALTTGSYRLCVEVDDSKQGSSFPMMANAKFYIQTQVLTGSTQDSDVDFPDVVKAKQVISLQQELEKVKETVELLLRKLQMARERETYFRDQSERINERVVWWSIAQTLFLIIAGSFQSVHLHNFFLQKKVA
jgi:hypothetical protein